MRLVAFLDEETTGKLDPAHRIIELSVRLCDLDTEEEKRNILWRFDPQRNIDAKAFAVHGITLDDLKGKPTIDKVIPDIYKVLKQCRHIVAHNGDGFDKPFLEMELARFGKQLPPVKWIDTMKLGTFATDFGKNPTLKELAWACDVDYDDALAHAGDYDTAVLRDCFFHAVRHGWIILED